MAQATLFTDDLLRRLIAVGQVDIVVGVPTMNNAATVAATLKAAEEGVARHFPRERTVIMSADGGSRDNTPEIVKELATAANARRSADGLRTRHRISATYGGVPGKAGAIRLIFAAADLLQSKAVVVLDPIVTSVTAAWIPALVTPLMKSSFDFVAPLYDRHPLEAPLLTQLLRPVLRATYGYDLHEPLIGEFGCSGRFASYCVTRQDPRRALVPARAEVWLTTTALAGTFTVCQAFLGKRTLAQPHTQGPGLSEVFPQIIGSLFASLDEHARVWLPKQGSEALPLVGPMGERTAAHPTIDATRMGVTFAQDVRDLRPVLESILAPDTLARLSSVAGSPTPEGPGFEDDLWVATVYDFISAHHVGVMDRAHVAQALMPLYLGRVAWFLNRYATSEQAEVEQALERLALEFERARPYLIERWKALDAR